jgi:hypothetical protein
MSLKIIASNATSHSREGGNPFFQIDLKSWILAFAGMTIRFFRDFSQAFFLQGDASFSHCLSSRIVGGFKEYIQ